LVLLLVALAVYLERKIATHSVSSGSAEETK
jgi:hypothetical protein